MNGTLSDEAIEAGEVVLDTLSRAGGVDILRRAVDDPSSRATVAELLDPIGLWDLDPRSDQLELEIAATASKAAGRYGVPYPVPERLGARPGGALALVSERPPQVLSHIDLPLEWSGVDLHGRTFRVASLGRSVGSAAAPFATEVVAEEDGGADARGAALVSVLQSWWLLGLVEAALSDTVQYTREREQFGRALIRFQSVGFHLADVAVAVQSFEEQAKYALWTIAEEQDERAVLAEAVALRLASQKAAATTMRAAHQLHGAMGFTDELDVSWLSLASQTTRRLPEGEHRTASILVELMSAGGWRSFGALSSQASAAVS